MICHLELAFRVEKPQEAANQNPPANSALKDFESTWSDFMLQSKYTEEVDSLCFSSLKTLKLDFSSWNLDSGSKLAVSCSNTLSTWPDLVCLHALTRVG